MDESKLLNARDDFAKRTITENYFLGLIKSPSSQIARKILSAFGPTSTSLMSTGDRKKTTWYDSAGLTDSIRSQKGIINASRKCSITLEGPPRPTIIVIRIVPSLDWTARRTGTKNKAQHVRRSISCSYKCQSENDMWPLLLFLSFSQRFIRIPDAFFRRY